jgi:hypothetical protein
MKFVRPTLTLGASIVAAAVILVFFILLFSGAFAPVR